MSSAWLKLVILLNVLNCSTVQGQLISAQSISDSLRYDSCNVSSCVNNYHSLVSAFEKDNVCSGNIQQILQKFQRTNRNPSHLVWVHFCHTIPCNSSDANYIYLWTDSSIFLMIDYEIFINLTFGLARIDVYTPERAFFVIPPFCNEVDNSTINEDLQTLTTQLTSIGHLTDDNDHFIYYAIKYANEYDYDEDDTNIAYRYFKDIINVWVLVSFIITVIGIHTVICIPRFRQTIGKFLQICDKRVSTLFRSDSNFSIEPDETKEQDSYFFSLLQGMIFPIMLAVVVYILFHNFQKFDHDAWFHHILPLYSAVITPIVTVIFGSFSMIFLFNQSLPSNFNIVILFIFLFVPVWGIYLMILHGFWLFIALLAYPGQILVSSVYIIPTLVIISVVWNVILEIIHSIKSCIGVLCCTKRCKKDEQCNCTSLKVDFCFDKKCENKHKYCCSLLCDIGVLSLVLVFIGSFCGLLIYIVYELIQFIHLHVELNLGIFGSLVANTVVVLVTSVLFFVNFFTIELVRRKSNAISYTAPFIYKIKNPCSKDIYNRSKTWCKKCISNLKIIFCCNYKQKSTQLMLQRAVELKFKEIIGCEERDLTQSNEQILKNIQEKLVRKIEEIVGTGNETQPHQVVSSASEVAGQAQDTGNETRPLQANAVVGQAQDTINETRPLQANAVVGQAQDTINETQPHQVVSSASEVAGQAQDTGNETRPLQANAVVGQAQDTRNETPLHDVLSNADVVVQVQDTRSETLPLGMIIVAVHNGIQQAIKEEIHGISLLTPVFSQDNQNALQEAVKHEIFDKLKNTDDHPVNVNKINKIINPQTTST